MSRDFIVSVQYRVHQVNIGRRIGNDNDRAIRSNLSVSEKWIRKSSTVTFHFKESIRYALAGERNEGKGTDPLRGVGPLDQLSQATSTFPQGARSISSSLAFFDTWRGSNRGANWVTIWGWFGPLYSPSNFLTWLPAGNQALEPISHSCNKV